MKNVQLHNSRSEILWQQLVAFRHLERKKTGKKAGDQTEHQNWGRDYSN